jgi:hypothetical protein
MFVAEEKAYRLAVEKKILAKGDWTPVTEGLDLLDRGLINVTPQYGAYAPEEILVQTLENPKHTVGRCAAIQEGLSRVTRLVPLFSKKWPLERSMDDALGRLKKSRWIRTMDADFDTCGNIGRHKILCLLSGQGSSSYQPTKHFLTCEELLPING